MRTLIRSTLALAIVLVATAAHAGPGVNLRWNACLGDAGVLNRSFACNTNTGSEVLVCSFQVIQEMHQVSGQEVTIDLVWQAPVMPDWWAFKNPSTCRQLSLVFNTVVSPTAVACADWSSGASVGGIGAYNIGPLGPNTARIKIASAVPISGYADLFPDNEYFVCNLVINHAKTVGTGSCGGCGVPACIVYRGHVVTTPVAANNENLFGPTNGTDSFFATWQGGTSFPFGGIPGTCPYPLPTRKDSWGALKSLYR